MIQKEYGCLDSEIQLMDKTEPLLENYKPRKAIILAAGFGMRMVPINMKVPKALLEVKGETLIERIIRQLHEVEIRKIYIVVGFMWEQFQFLVDKYGVNLIINPEYAEKNNLHSLELVAQYLCNSYIIPCDIWCLRNPFHKKEQYSWYMVSDRMDDGSEVRVNRNNELIKMPELSGGNAMIGICYLAENESEIVKNKIEQMSEDSKYDYAFWEEALYEKDRMIVSANIVKAGEVVEINTYEQLRELDGNSNQLKSDEIETAAKALGVDQSEIVNISVLKKGMTNRSFLFSCGKEKYIMRIPGEGTDKLINRYHEAEVYKIIEGKRICDDIIYIDSMNGYKITKYLQDARVCDPLDINDVGKCMRRLRSFHDLKLKVDHEFDIFEQIDLYESLWATGNSCYTDYQETKENVFALKTYIEQQEEEKVLTHIDAVSDNFLFVKNDQGQEEIRLIDWEYAGMQDPHVDIAMFCIYSLYNKTQIDRLIELYFVEGCPKRIRVKIYCYIAVCGLLWSNWCEYKRQLGVEFGEYAEHQYRYAKEYYKIVQNELKGKGELNV